MKLNKAILGIEWQVLLLLGFFLSSKLSIAQGQLQFPIQIMINFF